MGYGSFSSTPPGKPCDLSALESRGTAQCHDRVIAIDALHSAFFTAPNWPSAARVHCPLGSIIRTIDIVVRARAPRTDGRNPQPRNTAAQQHSDGTRNVSSSSARNSHPPALA
ncbi:unnamed protein product, partial [Ectocarpus fasciculatus]